jgi:hypothetical protein
MRFHLPAFISERAKKKRIQSRWLTKKLVIVYAILFTSFFICLAVFAEGGGFAESSTFSISFSTPAEGEAFTTGNVLVSGFAIGGILRSVVIWDEKYNVGMLASTGLNMWSLSIPVNHFSDGAHVICAKAQSTDGQWSPIICRTINTLPPTHITATGYISDTIPAGMGMLFKPAEVLGRTVVVLVSGGTAPDDQNGDNIPDQFQESPVTPNYNPSNVPILMTLVFSALIILLIVAVLGMKEYLSKREERLKALQSNPNYWKWRERK